MNRRHLQVISLPDEVAFNRCAVFLRQLSTLYQVECQSQLGLTKLIEQFNRHPAQPLIS